MITLEDGTSAEVGSEVYDYYSMVPVKIVAIDSDGWCDTEKDDGTRGAYLNGARMCSREFAKNKGWM